MQIHPPPEKPTDPVITNPALHGSVVNPTISYDGHHVILQAEGVTVFLTRKEVKQIVEVSKPFLTEFTLKQI